MDETLQAELWRTAHAMADAAGKAILPHFRTETLIADNKLATGFDPVTEADRAAERAMRAVLSEIRPDDAYWVKNTAPGWAPAA